ncbi:MAG: PCRF domain-containing protein, partial [Candidatus Paceibacteria bacterium]
MPSLEEYRSELKELSDQLADPEITKNQQKLADISRRHAFLSQLVGVEDRIEELKQRIAENNELMKMETSSDFQELIQEEIAELEQELEQKHSERKELLTPKKDIPKEIMVEIRAGAGGEEAGLFALELWQAYLNFLQEYNVSVSVLDLSLNDSGGLKEGIFEAKGEVAYENLQYESGVHRVQRVPATEKSGRIHTSTVTVAVLPVPKEVDINLDQN